MKLRYSANSPYVRKVLLVAFEAGLEGEIERLDTAVTPLREFPEIMRENPLAKVPILITRDGLPLFDSRVICEYLDSLHDGPKMFPASGPARWKALRQQALADGIQDAATAVRYETAMRPAAAQWPDWIEAQLRKVNAGLDALESEVPDLRGSFDIGQISVASTLGWIRLRLPDVVVGRRPALTRWFEEISARPSMQATVPPG